MKHPIVLSLLVFASATSMFAQSPFNVKISVGPVLVFGGYESGGFAADASLQYNIVSSLDATLTSGYYSFANAQVVPVLAGVRLVLSKTRVQPYLSVEVGGYFSWTEITPPIYDPIPFSFGGTFERTKSRQTFGGAFGFGFKIPIQGSFNLDLSATTQYAEGLADNLSIKMGMSFGL